MKIEVWSDYTCPFCYIGKRQLEKALQDTGFADQVEVSFKSYELDPNEKEQSNQSIFEMLATKYNTSVEAAKRMTGSVVARAKEVGLDYNFETMKPANTHKAHRLVKWAETKGKEKELNERLLKAYFIESKEIGLTEVLADLVKEIGLDREEAMSVLDSTQFSNDVKADIQQAFQIGVKGVPFFVLNHKYAISGAQPQEVFEEALRKVAEEEGIQPSLKVFGDKNTGVCTDDYCEF